MEQTKRNFMIMALIEMVVAIIMWLLTVKIAPVCAGMLELTSGKEVHMKCYYVAVVFLFIAVLLLVNGILALVVEPSVVSGVITIVAAVFIYAILNDKVGIGICANAEMACHVTTSYVKVCAAAEFICGLIHTIMAVKNKK